MRWFHVSIFSVGVCAFLAGAAFAQRGVGAPDGVARKAVLPDTVSLSGTVVEVVTGPCENTTGRAFLGTHFLMKNEEGDTLNIHLGPAGTVDSIAGKLTNGLEIQVKAFRTEQMKKDHYVAVRLTSGDRTVALRDATLRPAWAGGPGSGGDPGWAGNGRGYAPRDGWGYGRAGRGRGYGYGARRGGGYGRGRGQGRGGYRYAGRPCPRFGVWQPVEKAATASE